MTKINVNLRIIPPSLITELAEFESSQEKKFETILDELKKEISDKNEEYVNVRIASALDFINRKKFSRNDIHYKKLKEIIDDLVRLLLKQDEREKRQFNLICPRCNNRSRSKGVFLKLTDKNVITIGQGPIYRCFECGSVYSESRLLTT